MYMEICDLDIEHYDNILKKMLREMREIWEKNEIPARKKGQKCTGCSIKDVCFYKDSAYSVKSEISKICARGLKSAEIVKFIVYYG